MVAIRLLGFYKFETLMTVRILTLPKFVAEYCVMSVELMMDGVGTAASITVESY